MTYICVSYDMSSTDGAVDTQLLGVFFNKSYAGRAGVLRVYFIETMRYFVNSADLRSRYSIVQAVRYLGRSGVLYIHFS